MIGITTHMVKMESDRDTVMEEQVDWIMFQMIKTVPGISAHLVLPPAPCKNLYCLEWFHWFLHRLAAWARYRVIRNEDHVCQ